MTFHNLLFASLQIVALVAAAEAAIALVRLRQPGALLVTRQFLLAFCIALPFLEPRMEWTPGVEAGVSFSSRTAVAAAGHGFAWPSWPEALLGAIALGAAFRLIRLAHGTIRLGRLRRAAEWMPRAHDDLQAALGARAAIYRSDLIRSPVTFGWRHPAVLLPPECMEDRLIVCHELLHVRRRDWLFACFEQTALALFWFHPAMWWLVSRIQLNREQTVDALVVARLGARERYIGTLVRFASRRPPAAPMPVNPFLKQRHLRRRVDALLKEVIMTKSRTIFTAAALALAVVSTAWICIQALPLQAAPQDKQTPKRIRVDPEMQSKNLIHKVTPVYPMDAKAAGIQGQVVLNAEIDKDGKVRDLKVESGDDSLAQSALTAVRQWIYKPTLLNGEPIEVETTITVTYTLSK